MTTLENIESPSRSGGLSILEAQDLSTGGIKHRPRLLCLDGGGVYGLTELLVLRRVMDDIALAANLDSPPLPCKYFDLIGGVGMGGLVALMLGRLGMVSPHN
jgi:patatin-like phospholipase/acyl hydrolase